MNAMDLFEQIGALRREGRSFAVATVVARRAPVSPGHSASPRRSTARSNRHSGRYSPFRWNAFEHAAGEDVVERQPLEVHVADVAVAEGVVSSCLHMVIPVNSVRAPNA